jgi:hypothetical protein
MTACGDTIRGSANAQSNDRVTLEIFGNKMDGWGYRIHIDKKPVIDQPTIPAVGLNQKFSTFSDAEKVGKLVINNLLLGRLPTIKIEELNSLKIKYKIF